MTTSPRHRRISPRPAERGQVVVWSAFLLPLLLVAAGLTFDVGNMINIRDEFAGAVDAAAIAGAQALHDPKTNETFVRNAAKNIAAANQVPSLAKNGNTKAVTLSLNTANTAGGNIVIGTYNFTTKLFTRLTPPIDMSKANAVQVNATLSTAAGSLPLSFGRLVGMSTYDTSRTSTAALGGPIQAQPNCPIAVNTDVFSGKVKGFTAPDDIILSTRNVNDMMWTGFFGGTNASAVGSYFDNPASIPVLKTGDVINTTTANEGANYHALKDMFPTNSVVLLPVVDFASNANKTTGAVVGFVYVRVDAVYDSGSDKYLDGTVVKFKSGTSSKTTTAECFGLDCRAFLVN